MPDFGELLDVEATTAWPREARDFTPWLAENLGRLNAAIGLNLRLIATEADLPSEDDRFSADIHAINDDDDTTVLIENQLAQSDHTHLGQILTYLAGLEAKTIIWIAPRFKNAHLAAIRWLNEHTAEDYSFFAVRLRVVRIGSSPLAPLFDILEQPNEWQRTIASRARAAESLSGTGLARSEFWTSYDERHPARAADLGGRGSASRWRKFGSGLVVKYYITRSSAGIYVTAQKLVPIEEVGAALSQHEVELRSRLDAAMGPTDDRYYFLKHIAGSFQHPDDAKRLGDWLASQADQYFACMEQLFSHDKDGETV